MPTFGMSDASVLRVAGPYDGLASRPLTPARFDLHGVDRMPLFGRRILPSDTWCDAPHDVRRDDPARRRGTLPVGSLPANSKRFADLGRSRPSRLGAPV